MFDIQKYTIGWVCVVPVELVAARLILDAEHDATEYEAPLNDNNSYVFGNIGRHNVVIATLPRGEYGLSSAAGVARDMIRSFENVRIGLMVGIGGGAPLMEQDGWKRQDVRLGDVVVSIPGNGEAGVCQYDFGKAIQDQEFLMTGHLNSPPSSLLAAVTRLSTDFDLDGHNIDEDVAVRLASRPKIPKTYRRPDNNTDRLYKSTFVHPDTNKSCSLSCTTEENIIQRPPRNDEEEQNVAVHYGLIASANRLMKDALVRNALARKHGILCFEMEAAGPMNQLPFLVIRGICDYSDSHESEGWQGYAAMTAAAYARKLLLVLAHTKVEVEKKFADLQEIHDNIKHVTRQVDNVVMKMEIQNQSTLRRHVEKWLAAPDPSVNHNIAIDICHFGSGKWMLHSKPLHQWQEAQFPLLWLHGISGSGKTILTSTIIEHLRKTKNPRETLLFFYFDVQNGSKQRLSDVLRSLIKQICYAQAMCQNRAEQLYNTCQEGKSEPTTSQLDECFADMCGKEAVTIILDALDECSERDKLLTWIRETSHRRRMRLFVTSRPEYEIRASFEKYTSTNAMVELTPHLLNDDLRAFIRYQIAHDVELQRWQDEYGAGAEIEDSLMDRAGGMYRWVACQLDILKQCLDRPSLLKALQELPDGLDQTYVRILQQIPHGYAGKALRLLHFLVMCMRPLTLEEAVDIIAINPDEVPYFDSRNRLPKPREIVKLCGGLTRLTTRQIDQSTSYAERSPAITGADKADYQRKLAELFGKTAISPAAQEGDHSMFTGNSVASTTSVTELQLAHPSVREFLSPQRLGEAFKAELWEFQGNATIVQTSLAYLYAAWSMQREGQEKDLPFKDLAAKYWFTRVTAAQKEGKQVMKWINKAFLSEGFRLYWMRCHTPDGPFRLLSPNKQPTALYLASLGGLADVVKILLEQGADVNDEGGPGMPFRTALEAASGRGHLDLVKLLLQNGAVVETDCNALRWASRAGHLQIVELLLENGAGINAVQDAYDDSALYAALENGHFEIATLLLQQSNINVNVMRTKPWKSTPALVTALESQQIDVVKLLLEKGAKINVQGGVNKNTPLLVAIDRGYVGIVKQLLQSGADVNMRGGIYGDSPLIMALRCGHVEIAKLLLDKDVDVNVTAAEDLGAGASALRYAVEDCDVELAKLLLNKGADPNRFEGRFSSPLLLVALRRDCVELAQLLITNGADINFKSERACAMDALLEALHRGYIKIARAILQRNDDINLRFWHGDTVLIQASMCNEIEIVKYLLKRGADTDAIGFRNDTAFISALQLGRVQIAGLLLQQGANIHPRGGAFHASALQIASRAGYLQLARLILNRGADVNAQGGVFDEDAVYPITGAGPVDAYKLLFDIGIDVNGEEFQHAIRTANFSISSVLEARAFDVNLNGKGGYFDTPLKAASSAGHLEVVKLLLDEGADVVEQNLSYGGVLQAAACYGNAEVVEFLLQKGAIVHEQGGYYGTAVQAAAASGSLESVQLLLDAGARVDAQGGYYGSALQAASYHGHDTIMNLLLDKGADIHLEGGQYGSALHAASSHGHVQAIMLLLSRGADIHAQASPFGSALQAASYFGQLDEVKLLLDSGANIDALGGEHGNAIQSASMNGHVEVVSLLIDSHVDMSGEILSIAFHRAAEHGHVAVVKHLLDASSHITMAMWETAFKAACTNNHPATVEFFLNAGLKAAGDQYRDLLQSAIEGRRVEVAKVLYDAGVDVTGLDEWDLEHTLEAALRKIQKRAKAKEQSQVG